MPSREGRTLVRLAGVDCGMSEILMPARLVQISCTTELPVLRTVMLRMEAPEPTELLVVTMLSKLPAAVGVPLMTPLELLRLSPGGNPLAVKPKGELAPVSVKVKGWPRKATAVSGLVMTAGAFEPPVKLVA